MLKRKTTNKRRIIGIIMAASTFFGISVDAAGQKHPGSYEIYVWVVRPQLKSEGASSLTSNEQSPPVFTPIHDRAGSSNTAILKALNACNKDYLFSGVQERYTKIVREGETWNVPLKHSLFRIRPVNASHDAILAAAGLRSTPAARQIDAQFFRKWLAIYTTSIINDPSKGGSLFLPQKSYGPRFIASGNINFVEIDTEATSDPRPNHQGQKEMSEAVLFSVTPYQSYAKKK